MRKSAVVGTVTRSRASLNRGLHVELRETKGKKITEKIWTAAGDSFQTGQTAKALQGYRVQSLPRRTPASGIAVTVDNIRITSSVESSENCRPGDFFLNPLKPLPNLAQQSAYLLRCTDCSQSCGRPFCFSCSSFLRRK